MKIVVTHSTAFDYEGELYAPLRASALARAHTLILPHEPDNRDIPTKTQLRDTQLVVAEVSHPSTGQGIELGYADMMGVPILMLHRIGTRPSGSLRFLSGTLVAYDGPDDLVRLVQAHLEQPHATFQELAADDQALDAIAREVAHAALHGSDPIEELLATDDPRAFGLGAPTPALARPDWLDAAQAEHPPTMVDGEPTVADDVAVAWVKRFYADHHGTALYPDEVAEALELDVLQTVRLCERLRREGEIALAQASEAAP